ncbi:MAG TPA: hypothetical protein VGF33_03030 [Caulobacteraceae bacterium]|jgi:hypothetical protein
MTEPTPPTPRPEGFRIAPDNPGQLNKLLPPAVLLKPYNGKLAAGIDGAKFKPGPLGAGLSIDADGAITGTPTDIGPHRFEVMATHKEHGNVFGSFAISAAPPPRSATGEADLPPAGVPLAQVEAMIAEAVAKAMKERDGAAEDSRRGKAAADAKANDAGEGEGAAEGDDDPSRRHGPIRK